MPLNLLRRLSALALVALPFAQPAVAQGLFSPAITVNDQVITGYEIEQRKAMLRLLRAPGDPERTARDQLIDDRLRIEASAAAGIEPGPDEIAEGIRILGAHAPGSVAELMALAGDEAAPAQSADAMMVALITAHEALAADLRAAIAVAQEAEDEVSAGFLTDRLEWHEKELWMMKASRA